MRSSKQPSVLPVFFLTEMWERFGFYIIQGLLVLYMTSQVLGFSDSKSYAISGAFSALSYITPILGGYAASRILGYEHAVILGGILLAMGYALLSLHHETFLYISLATISLGNGFFKPNISSYLGSFYKPTDPQREKGYTIFYIGINVGSLIATGTSGYIVRYYGWHMPYFVASIGLCLGVMIFTLGLSTLKKAGKFHLITPPSANKSPRQILLVYVSSVILFLIAYNIIIHTALANNLMLITGILIFTFLVFLASRYEQKTRNKLLACIFLTTISIVFWAFFFQLFFSMNLFIERAVDRHFYHFQLPTPLFLSLESVFIILVGPVLAVFWQKLSVKNKNPSIPIKFTLSLFMVTLAFFVIYIGTQHPDVSGKIDKFYIVFGYLCLTIGELFISPIGLTMVTVLTPSKLVGMMMGVWFVALGLGIKLGGVIANFAAIPKDIHRVTAINAIYGHAFLIYTLTAFVFGLICLGVSPILKKLIES